LRAEQAVARHFARRNADACSSFLTWFDDADRLRAKLARLFGGAADDYCFIPMANAALTLMARGIEWRPGDRLVTLENEFPNQIYASALLPPGVDLVETPYAEIGRYLDDGRTRLVALSAMSYSNGFRPPLDELLPELRRRGILSFVDGTQGAGVLVQDMDLLKPDFYACHAYKWMLAPAGAGFAYVPPQTRAWLLPYQVGWRSHKDWRNVDALHHGRPEFSPGAERYEGGMLPAALLDSLDASVDLFLEIGRERIEARALGMAARVREAVIDLGGELAVPGDSPIIAVRFPGHDARAIARRLKEDRVLVSARQGNLRVSCHFYNNEDDVQRFANALRLALSAGCESD
jgi:selenocysteine lyase/cysteine desulfurase